MYNLHIDALEQFFVKSNGTYEIAFNISKNGNTNIVIQKLFKLYCPINHVVIHKNKMLLPKSIYPEFETNYTHSLSSNHVDGQLTFSISESEEEYFQLSTTSDLILPYKFTKYYNEVLNRIEHKIINF